MHATLLGGIFVLLMHAASSINDVVQLPTPPQALVATATAFLLLLALAPSSLVAEVMAAVVVLATAVVVVVVAAAHAPQASGCHHPRTSDYSFHGPR